LEAATRELLAALREQAIIAPTAAPEAPSQELAPVSRVVELPPDMRLLHILGRGSSSPGFELVVRADPGPYDRAIIADRPYSDIAVLLNLDLGGVATLIDPGANVGTIAMAVAAAGSNVIAIEMLPGNCLRQNLEPPIAAKIRRLAAGKKYTLLTLAMVREPACVTLPENGIVQPRFLVRRHAG
jgi:hypothetical protein